MKVLPQVRAFYNLIESVRDFTVGNIVEVKNLYNKSISDDGRKCESS